MAVKKNIAIASLCFATLLSSGCQTPASNAPAVGSMPMSDPDKAATLHFRTTYTPTDVLHDYLISIDGIRAAFLENDTHKKVQLDAGTHEVKVACYITNMDLIAGEKRINYARPDDTLTEEIETLPGDELCYKVYFDPINCAKISEEDLDFCTR